MLGLNLVASAAPNLDGIKVVQVILMELDARNLQHWLKNSVQVIEFTRRHGKFAPEPVGFHQYVRLDYY